MSQSIEWRCPVCERPSLQDLEPGGRLVCGHCDHAQGYHDSAIGTDGSVADPVDSCLACGYDRMYLQKDFNRKIGLAIVVVGALLSPWTYGLSLVVCMGLDYGLYHFVPEITVCYGCDAIHRGFQHNPRHRAHDPLLADRYKRESPANANAVTDAATSAD